MSIATPEDQAPIRLEIRGRVAVITVNSPHTRNPRGGPLDFGVKSRCGAVAVGSSQLWRPFRLAVSQLTNQPFPRPPGQCSSRTRHVGGVFLALNGLEPI
jgi:hypothetical protein